MLHRRRAVASSYIFLAVQRQVTAFGYLDNDGQLAWLSDRTSRSVHRNDHDRSIGTRCPARNTRSRKQRKRISQTETVCLIPRVVDQTEHNFLRIRSNW